MRDKSVAAYLSFANEMRRLRNWAAAAAAQWFVNDLMRGTIQTHPGMEKETGNGETTKHSAAEA